MSKKLVNVILNTILIFFLIGSCIYFYLAVSKLFDYLIQPTYEEIAENRCSLRILKLERKYLLYVAEVRSEYEGVKK